MKEVSDYMRFAISRPFYNEPDEILSAYPILKEYNPKIDFPYRNEDSSRLTVEIADLVKFRESIGQDIILTGDYSKDNMLKVIIYDDYVE